ncbi:hypothetical protein SLE2022_404050 [Rubroshorea leprosula]
MAEIHSSAAENIMSRDLEISAEMDTETLRGWFLARKEMLLLDVTVLGRHDPSLWNNRGHCLPSAFRGHQSSFSELFIAANSASLACKAARQVELSRAGEGDAFQEQANQKFHFEFRTSTSCCSWCFTISIGNERRSGGTCGTTYWITPVRHEAADAESAPMPLAMPCLVPRRGGDSVARHEHRAKGRLSNSSEPPYLTTT